MFLSSDKEVLFWFAFSSKQFQDIDVKSVKNVDAAEEYFAG